ncbi:Crp/Fnr family transcriptional regulator [Chelatococcus sp. SYSU_G07232]|uniref:Crp/Fnr family transcriptional regulator n=1 Tax=Chelatococcus albus TaxID=3047466 RepID=A0ABT7AH71_9HYPH|nr:Crp/Fnr family transcriptional regulator [Chelatococcus sp. SYSU_G07232]MDJ1158332.1 Crp/Fnr family transcriptional regulator [Chelatococcus sp. SYSU_G07232]
MISSDRLQGIATWASELSDEECERACRGIVEKTYAKGSYICHRGDRLDAWLGVVSGLVKVSTISNMGKAVTFAGVPSGGWFGEGTVLKDEARQYDLVALRDTRLAMMNGATFRWLFEHSVGFNRFLVRQLNERLGQFIALIGYDRMLDAPARVARCVAWLFNPVLYPSVGSFLEISQEELGLLCGLSRQVTNKSLKDLEAAGLVRIEHGGLAVVDLKRLGRYGE